MLESSDFDSSEWLLKNSRAVFNAEKSIKNKDYSFRSVSIEKEFERFERSRKSVRKHLEFVKVFAFFFSKLLQSMSVFLVHFPSKRRIICRKFFVFQ